MADKSEGNGKVSILLWVNTLLTALILPLLGFMGSRLWASVDDNGKQLNELTIQLSVVKERQGRVFEELLQLKAQDSRFSDLLDEHLKAMAKP